MIEPNAQDIAAAKASAAKKFGQDRLVGVTFADPLTNEPLAELLIVRLTYADAVAYYDARTVSILQARSALLAERMMWPDPAALSELRDAWAAFDRRVEDEYRAALGFSPGHAIAHARPFSLSTAPPGLEVAKAKELLAANEGVRLWSVYLRDNGLACVIRSPTPDVWTMTQTQWGEAEANKRNQLCPSLDVISDHCVWCPAPTLRAHIEELPGRAADLPNPWQQLGGAAAKTSSRFL